MRELPKKSKIYPICPPLVPITRGIIQELAEMGLLEPSMSICQSSCFLVAKNSDTKVKMNEAKKKGEFRHEDFMWRFIVDLHNLNSVIIPKYAGISSVTHVYDMMWGKTYTSCLDIAQSFYQLKIHPDSRYLTSIGLDAGLSSWQFARPPMGLTTSPAALQLAMAKILNPILRLIPTLQRHTSNTAKIMRSMNPTKEAMLTKNKCLYATSEDSPGIT